LLSPHRLTTSPGWHLDGGTREAARNTNHHGSLSLSTHDLDGTNTKLGFDRQIAFPLLSSILHPLCFVQQRPDGHVLISALGHYRLQIGRDTCRTRIFLLSIGPRTVFRFLGLPHPSTSRTARHFSITIHEHLWGFSFNTNDTRSATNNYTKPNPQRLSLPWGHQPLPQRIVVTPLLDFFFCFRIRFSSSRRTFPILGRFTSTFRIYPFGFRLGISFRYSISGYSD
jgi:hypothetical protein